MKTLTPLAHAERLKDSPEVVFLVEAEFSEHNRTALIRRWASRAYTLNEGVDPDTAWEDVISPERGLSLGAVSLKPRGGLARVTSSSLALIDLDDLSADSTTHVVQGDPVKVWMLFVTGAEDKDDRIEIARGVVDRPSIEDSLWRLAIKDDSTKLLKSFPTSVLDPDVYPDAFDLGGLIPLSFGDFRATPDNTTGAAISLAPCVITDRFGGPVVSAGNRVKSIVSLWQWYPQANVFAKCLEIADAVGDGVGPRQRRILSPKRRMILQPASATSANTETDWRKVADGNAGSSAALSSGEVMAFYMAGSPPLGEMTAITIKAEATGTYTYTLFDDTKQRATGTQTGNLSLALTLSEWSGWELELMNLRFASSGGATFTRVWLEIEFNDYRSSQEGSSQIWAEAEGFQDRADFYRDGPVITSNGTVLRNPVHILEAILRSSDLMAIEDSQVVGGWAAAATSRSQWKFDLSLRRRQGSAWIDKFCFEAGLSMFPDAGGLSVVAIEHTREPDIYLSGDYHMPMIRGTDPDPSHWRYGLTRTPVRIDDIINEAHLRYAVHPGTGRPQKARTASGYSRLTGNCTVVVQRDGTGRLTDVSATFQSDDVLRGERIYIDGDFDYVVLGVESETVLSVGLYPSGNPSAITTPRKYWLGPSLDGRMLLSQITYGTTKALGGQQETFADDGGYQSVFIRDEITADLFLNWLALWYALPRDTIRFTAYHQAVSVQPGDMLMLDHRRLSSSQRPTNNNSLAAAVTKTETVWTLTEAPTLQAGNYILLVGPTVAAPEACKVTSVDVAQRRVTVDRGALLTEPMAHAAGATIQLLTKKWLVTSVTPPTPDRPVVEIEAVEAPLDSRRVGQVSPENYPSYAAASPAQRLLSGFITLANGRVDNLDPNSAISHIGAA